MDATLLQQAKQLIDQVRSLPLRWHARCHRCPRGSTDCSRTGERRLGLLSHDNVHATDTSSRDLSTALR